MMSWSTIALCVVAGSAEPLVRVGILNTTLSASCSGAECPTPKLAADALQAWCQEDHEAPCTAALLPALSSQLPSGFIQAADVSALLAGVQDVAKHNVTGAQLKAYLSASATTVVSRGVRYTTHTTAYVELQRPYGFCRSWVALADADWLWLAAPIDVLAAVDGTFNATEATVEPATSAVASGLALIFNAGDTKIPSIAAARNAAEESTVRANPVEITESATAYYTDGASCTTETDLATCFAADCRRCAAADGTAAAGAADQVALATAVADAQQCDEAHLLYSTRILGNLFPKNRWGSDCLDLSNIDGCYGGHQRRVTFFKQMKNSYPNVFTATSGGAFFSGPLYQALGEAGAMEVLTSGGTDGNFDGYGVEQADFFGAANRVEGAQQFGRAMRWLQGNSTTVVSSNAAFTNALPGFNDVSGGIKRFAASSTTAYLQKVIAWMDTLSFSPLEISLSPQADASGYEAFPLEMQEASRLAQETLAGTNRFIFMGGAEESLAKSAGVLPFLDGAFSAVDAGSPSSPGLALGGRGASATLLPDAGEELRDRSRFHLVGGPVSSDRIGHFSLEKRNGVLRRTKARIVRLTKAVAPDDPTTLNVMSTLLSRVQSIMGRVVGSTAVPFDWERAACRSGDCPMNRIVAEAAFSWCKKSSAKLQASGAPDARPCDFAIVNSGSVRSGVPAGDLTALVAQTVTPFGNSYMVAEIPGKELIEILRHGVSTDGAGHFMTGSGLRVAAAAIGGGQNELIEAQVYNETSGTWGPILHTTTYRFAANSFIMSGGDGYTQFGGLPVLEAFAPAIDYQVVAAYFEELGDVTELATLSDLQERCGGADGEVQPIAELTALTRAVDACYVIKTNIATPSREIQGVCGYGYAPHPVTGCAPCAAGEFQPIGDVAEVTCLPCGAGRFSSAGAETCTACPVGYWSPQAATNCTICPVGHWWDGALGCVECRPGSASGERGAAECSLCDIGYYRSNSDPAHKCVACGTHRTTQLPGASSSAQCVCSEGFFAFDGDCVSCPAGYTCPVNSTQPLVLRGHWAKRTASPAEYASQEAYSCGKHAEFCTGGTYDEQCGEDRRGFLCSHCPNGFYADPRGCTKCEAGSELIAPAVFTVFLLSPLLVHAAFRGQAAEGPHGSLSLLLLTVAGQTLVALQVIGALSTFSENLPVVSGLMHAAHYALLDVADLRTVCSNQGLTWSLATTLIQCFPLAFIGLYVGYSYVLRPLGVKMESPVMGNNVGKFFSIVQLTMLRIGLRVFECYEHPAANQQSSVVSAPEVLCDLSSDEYALPYAFAFCNLVFLTALIPAQVYLLIKAPSLLVDKRWRSALRFITERYRPTTFHFSLLLSLRNAALAFVGVVAPTSVTLQLSLYALILLSWLAATLAYKPWRSPHINLMDSSLSFALVAFCLTSLAYLYESATIALAQEAGELLATNRSQGDFLGAVLVTIPIVSITLLTGWGLIMMYANRPGRVERVEEASRLHVAPGAKKGLAKVFPTDSSYQRARTTARKLTLTRGQPGRTVVKLSAAVLDISKQLADLPTDARHKLLANLNWYDRECVHSFVELFNVELGQATSRRVRVARESMLFPSLPKLTGRLSQKDLSKDPGDAGTHEGPTVRSQLGVAGETSHA